MGITRKIQLRDTDGSGIRVAERDTTSDKCISVHPLQSGDAWITLEQARDFAAELIDLCGRIGARTVQ